MNSNRETFDRILLFGSEGMLGHAMIDELTRRGLQAKCPKLAELDMRDVPSVTAVFADARPTLVLNCAALTNVDGCEKEPKNADAINGYAVGTLAELCKSHGSAIVHISTDFVFDGNSSKPYRTDEKPNPLSAYGRSKLLGETQLQENAPNRWLIVRTAWLYGRHGPNFPRIMVEAARAGKPLRVVNDQKGSPTYTVDLARAIFELLDCGAHGIWHFTNSGTTTWYDFAQAALTEFGVQANVESITSAQWKAIRPTSAIRPTYSVLDIEPLAKQIGHAPRPWQEALADYRAAVQRDGF